MCCNFYKPKGLYLKWVGGGGGGGGCAYYQKNFAFEVLGYNYFLRGLIFWGGVLLSEWHPIFIESHYDSHLV